MPLHRNLMRGKFTWSTVALLSVMAIAPAVWAENLKHLYQLLNTKQCANCDLSRSGLVQSELSGADLRGANLAHANLSRANLVGADLSGANLAGASLYGANLGGANLVGANLAGTDLRDAYLTQAKLLGVDLSQSYVQGAIGIPSYAGKPEHFHAWGLAEAERGNFPVAVENYNKALSIDPDYAPAYMGRSISRYQMGDESGAMQDAQIAADFFEKQNNPSGAQAANDFMAAVDALNAAEEKRDKATRGSALNNVFRGVTSLLFQFLPLL